MDIRFASNNEHKITEAQSILGPAGINVLPVRLKIDELQVQDPARLVRDKVLKGFEAVGRPLFVEHTGLYLSQLNGLPGGLTQVFWDSLQADTFAALFGGTDSSSKAVARTDIAYCDSHRIHEFSGEIVGSIAAQPRGSRDFQWDCVFQPEGFTKTFAELGDQKSSISMRKIALDLFADFLLVSTR